MIVFNVGVDKLFTYFKLISVVIFTSSKSIASDLANNHCNSNNSIRHNKEYIRYTSLVIISLEYFSFQFSSGLISQFVNTCTFEDSTDFVPRNFLTKFFFFLNICIKWFFLAEIERRRRCRPQ